MTVVLAPVDWDGEMLCIECGEPATHERINGMHGDAPVYDVVCCGHATRVWERVR